MGRLAHGVRAINLSADDYVVGSAVMADGKNLLVVTENGLGKVTESAEYKVQSRGGKGVKTYRITEKSGLVAGVKAITNDDDVMLITSKGIVIRIAVSGISVMGRATQGVMLMRATNGEKVVSIAISAHEDEELDEEVLINETDNETQGEE